MYSVLIVEDFYIDRENLRELVDSFGDIGVAVAGVCAGGRQALEFIRAHEPDIVISDIEMPGMGGLELGRTVRREFPDIRFIFSTLYDRFQYAKEALELESDGYIMKPVDAGELRECLSRVTRHIEAQSRRAREYEGLRALLYESRPALAETFVKSLVYGLAGDPDDAWGKIRFLDLDIRDGLFILALIELDDYAARIAGRTVEQKQLFSLRIYEEIKKAVAGCTGAEPVRLDDAHFAVLFSDSGGCGEAAFSRSVMRCCSDMLEALRPTEGSLSLAVSECYCNLKEIGSLYEQCSYILRYKYTLGKGKVLCASDIQSAATVPDIDYKGIQKDLRFLLNSGTADELAAYADRQFAGVPWGAGDKYPRNLGFHIAVCVQAVLNENNADFDDVRGEGGPVWDTLVSFETAADMKEYLKRLLAQANALLGRKATSRNRAVSDEVVRYIGKNYMRDLSLESISADLFYSPNYLNSLFKQETGGTIYDYVCRFRMEKAKEMLGDPGMKLCDIAEALGYSHAAYFNSVFKKYTGLTPREYRERRA